MEFSVILVVLNEEQRIRDSLERIQLMNPTEIIVVDGGSKDKTVIIAREFTNNITISTNSNLTRDRQIGIDKAKYDLLMLIDADHRVNPDIPTKLYNDMQKYNLDIVQSGLSFLGDNFLAKAENQLMDITINKPGKKEMIGVAPAMYKKEIFNSIKFDSNITETIDDTDFIYRLKRDTVFQIGNSSAKIQSFHYGSLNEYLKKFKWYGIGDGEFCIKHPFRAWRMFFHLLINYLFILPIRGMIRGKFKLLPYCWLQGSVRFFYCAKKITLNFFQGK